MLAEVLEQEKLVEETRDKVEGAGLKELRRQTARLSMLTSRFV